MKYPVPVELLGAALPHRHPMVWVDEVLSAAVDGGICAVDLAPERLFAAGEAHCLTFAPIEWMAQTYGYARACHALMGKAPLAPLKKAYLVGVGQLECFRPVPSRGRLLVEVRTTREMAPLSIVRGSVKDDGGEIFAEATLKLYFE